MSRTRSRLSSGYVKVGAALVAATTGLWACSSDKEGASPGTGGSGGDSSAGGASSGGDVSTSGAGPSDGGASQAGGAAGSAGMNMAGMNTAGMNTAGMNMGGMNVGGMTGMGGAAPGSGGAPTQGGVTVPGVACGVQNPQVDVTIGGRNVIVDYPCADPGTPVTFILNLHGTAPQDTEDAKTYMRYYIPMYKYTQSHSFVIASPRAIGTQWERGGGMGQDIPHLLEVIDWVYANLGGDGGFDIRAMWVTGHSWGAAFGLSFVCRDEFTVDGYVHMSGGSGAPDCADQMALLATQGETDIVMGLPDQTAIASGHGCGAATMLTIGGNDVTDWPDCDPGYAHKNYVFQGKGHGFSPVDWPDEPFQDDVAEIIRSTRP